MHTIYGGKTLNGIEVEDMVDNSKDYVVFKEGSEFFARPTMLGFTNKPDDQRKPGIALFYNGHKLCFTPLFAIETKEGEEDYGPLIKRLFGLAGAAGIYNYTAAELEAITNLVQKLDGIKFKDCDATDSDGHTTEGIVEYEGKEYYVYSSAYSPLSFEAECARDILEAKKKEAEKVSHDFDVYLSEVAND